MNKSVLHKKMLIAKKQLINNFLSKMEDKKND